MEDKKVGNLPLEILPSYLLTFLQKIGENAKDSLRAFPRPNGERARVRGKACNRRSNPIKHENNEIATLHTVARNDKVSCLQLSVSRKDDKTSYTFAKQTVTSLPSYPPALLPSKRKSAFTLAEVLVTLGIIGVVAALTMPSLVAKYKEQVVITKVKTFYSEFSQAYLMAVNDNGTIDNWGLKDTIKVKDENDEYVLTDDGVETFERFFDVMEPYLKKVSRNKVIKDYDKSRCDTYILANGLTITGLHYTGHCNEGYCGDFYVRTDSRVKFDENGNRVSGAYNNSFGFKFKPHRIVPYGLSNSEFNNQCKNGTNKTRCTAWVLYNGNMDYLHCPEKLGWNKQHSCKK